MIIFNFSFQFSIAKRKHKAKKQDQSPEYKGKGKGKGKGQSNRIKKKVKAANQDSSEEALPIETKPYENIDELSDSMYQSNHGSTYLKNWKASSVPVKTPEITIPA